MPPRVRKILLIVLFVAATVGFAFLLYALFFRGGFVPAPPSPVNAPGGSLPTSGPGTGLPGAAPSAPVDRLVGEDAPDAVAGGGLTLAETLVRTVVTSPNLAIDGRSMNYYDRSNGQFFTIDPATNKSKPLSNKVFPSVQNALWHPTGEIQAILEFPDGRNIFYDFDTEQQVTLPTHWEDFEWAPSGNELVAKSIGLSESNRFLIITNPDGTNARPIAELRNNADKVDISYSPNNDMVAFSRTGQAQSFGRQEVIPIGKNRENFRSLIVEGIGFKSRWAPDGARLLYSAANATSDWKPALWVVNGRGDDIGTERKRIGLATWVDKCSFASPTIAYCAAPRELPSGAAFSRDIANDTPDDLYRIDLQTGQYRLVATPSEASAISQIIVAKDGSLLYYTELTTGALKKIRLR